MGEIRVTGKSTREFQYDRMKITVTFETSDVTTSKAMDRLATQCEECLEELSQQGFETKEFQIEKDEVCKNKRLDRTEIIAKREINISFPFDMKISSFLMNFFKTKGYDTDINISYSLSNLKEVHEQLLEEAVQDSKQKAEKIAKMVNEEIIGIKTIEAGDRISRIVNKGPMYTLSPARICVPDFLKKTSELNAGYTSESESVEIIWLLSGNE